MVGRVRVGVEWAIELSGEHETLARAEARALVEMQGARVQAADLDRVVLASGELDAGALAARIAFARRVLRVIGQASVPVEEIVEVGREAPVEGERFAVRCTRLDAGLDPSLVGAVEERLGEVLSETGIVDLEAPDRVVRVLLDREAVVGVDAATVDRGAFEDRHVEARPFFSPVSLHPRLARCLVNLAGVEAGDRVWDPFVGTGGVALEAGLVGARVVASDLDADMLEGARSTLSHFDVDAELVEGDVGEVAEGVGRVEAVVTDPPYGRASSTNREEIEALYERFFRAAEDALGPEGRLVGVVPDPELARLAPAGLEKAQEHAWYVHGSLTRHVVVFERI